MGKQRASKLSGRHKKLKQLPDNLEEKKVYSKVDAENYEAMLISRRKMGWGVHKWFGISSRGRLSAAKSALFKGQPIGEGDWGRLILEIQSGNLDITEVTTLLDGMDTLVKKYGEDAVVTYESILTEEDKARRKADSSVFDATQLLLEHYRLNYGFRGKRGYGDLENTVKYWPNYSALIREDLNTARYSNNHSRTQEIARRLSFNASFLESLQQVREKWSIEINKGFVSYLASEDPYYLYPNRLISLMSSAQAPNIKFYADLKEIIFTKFPLLDYGEDYGLIIGALCIGLEPYDVINHWREISLISSYGSDKNLEVIEHIDETPRLIAGFLTIAYLIKHFMPSLSTEIHDTSVNISLAMMADMHETLVNEKLASNLPSQIIDEMVFALVLSRELEILGMENLPDVIDLLRVQRYFPSENSLSKPEILVRITPETFRAHFENFWPQIEMARVSLWGQGLQNSSPRDVDTWREYERDAKLKEIIESIKREGQKPSNKRVAERYQEIYKEPLSDNVFRATDVVKKARKRWEEKMEELEGNSKQESSVPKKRRKVE